MFTFLVSAQLLFSETKVISSNALGKVIEPKLFTEKTAFQNVSEQLLVEDFDSFVYFFLLLTLLMMKCLQTDLCWTILF